jgi:hypothetical protein
MTATHVENQIPWFLKRVKTLDLVNAPPHSMGM